MPNFIVVRPHIYVAGAVILAVNHNDNENTLYTAHNGSANGTTGHTHTGAAGDSPILTAVPTLVPIGTIIAFYDFNAALTFNTTYWAYCNGQIKNVGTLGAQTLPDMSNRYLVGFGTEGGGDNGTLANWATPPIGNASHQINIAHTHTSAAHTHTTPNHAHTLSAHTHAIAAHTHTMANHTHDLANHTHIGAAHTHTGGLHTHTTDGGLSDLVYTAGGTGTRDFDTGPGGLVLANGANDQGDHQHAISVNTDTGTSANSTGSTTPGAGSGPSTNTSGTPSTNTTDSTALGATAGPNTDTTDTSGGGTSGSTTPGDTGSALSTTQSIQPRSIRVRFLMRIL